MIEIINKKDLNGGCHNFLMRVDDEDGNVVLITVHLTYKLDVYGDTVFLVDIFERNEDDLIQGDDPIVLGGYKLIWQCERLNDGYSSTYEISDVKLSKSKIQKILFACFDDIYEFGYNDRVKTDIAIALLTDNVKYKDIKSSVMKIFDRIGIQTTSNFQEITDYIYRDVCETAAFDNWNEDDVAIGFRRWIENKHNKDYECK